MSIRMILPKPPPLQNGDQLSRPEFERRYFNQGLASPEHAAFVARLNALAQGTSP